MPSRRRRDRRLRRLRKAREGFVDVATMFEVAEMAVTSNEHPQVELPLPYMSASLIPRREMMELVEIPGKGRGWVAAENIDIGTTLVVERCLAMVYDHDCDDDDDDAGSGIMEDDDDDDLQVNGMEEGDNSDTARLVLRILRKAKEANAKYGGEYSYWQGSGLCHLFPRNYIEARGLEAWKCCDTFLDAAVAHAIQSALKLMPEGNWDLLPLIIRHNALGISTNPEMLSHPITNWHRLSGLALYSYRPSSFNHSYRPNVMRWHCGDIGVWLVIRPVVQGEELTISYVESELLGDDLSKPLRQEGLAHLEFGQGSAVENKKKRIRRTLDVEEQNRLVAEFGPKGRLAHLKKLKPKLKCDQLQKCILEALSWAEANNASNARRSFLDALNLAKAILPNLDEQLICLGFHAAQAALASDQLDQAASLLEDAADIHNLVFGGGRRLFLQRFRDDLDLDLGYRPKPKSEDLTALLLDDFDARFCHISSSGHSFASSNAIFFPFDRQHLAAGQDSDSDDMPYPLLQAYNSDSDDAEISIPLLSRFTPQHAAADSEIDEDEGFEEEEEEEEEEENMYTMQQTPNDAIIYMDVHDDEDDLEYDLVD